MAWNVSQGEDVPMVFVLPRILFECGSDENYVEVEFPIYFNFFVKKAFMDRSRRLILIG